MNHAMCGRGALVLVTLWAKLVSAQTPPMAPGTVADTRLALPSRRAAEVLAQRVTLRIERTSLKRVIDAVALAAAVQIQYRASVVGAVSDSVALNVTNRSLGSILDRLLAGTGLRTVVLAGEIISIERGVPQDDQRLPGIVSGAVHDKQTGRPLGGALVLVDNATRGVSTGNDGTFRITGVAAGTHRLSVRLIGYGRQAKDVSVVENQTVTADFILDAHAFALDQVVVTGAVIATELKAIPNAITVITAKQIEERGITRIDQLFRGDVPGVFAMNMGTSDPLGQVTMFSRGTTALSRESSGTSVVFGVSMGTNAIKTYVDGVELADPEYLSQIDPKSIERIEILTGPQASTIYGSNAINGVMQIFTKRGTSNTPQLTLNLLSGWVENNFSPARTPKHADNVQMSGIDGRVSYSGGTSWDYMGPWSPAQQMARVSVFGGARLQWNADGGPVSADITFRQGVTHSVRRGAQTQFTTQYRETGWYSVSGAKGLIQPQRSELDGQTLGLTLSYRPFQWWLHELVVGQDISDTEARYLVAGFANVSDTTLEMSQTHTIRHSLRYATTSQFPIRPGINATVTFGGDGWQSVASSMVAQPPQTLTGTLYGYIGATRQPSHNAGAFTQAQLGLVEQLYLTYGLRAEWNPDYGAAALPNYAPRYGLAYTREFGAVTAKLRASYGRSTRPPSPRLKNAETYSQAFYDPIGLADYGDFDYYLANPDLAPEYQQGGEGGMELYWGTWAALTVTRYNQTVDNLIVAPFVDSTRSLTTNFSGYDVLGMDGYGYKRQSQYLNLGSIRNQGWETQANFVTGPFTIHGTYSWTKSRVIGITPKYRALFVNAPQYQPGATFQYLPEHTWAAGISYVRTRTNVSLNVTGNGKFVNGQNELYTRYLSTFIRLPAYDRWSLRQLSSLYTNIVDGYAIADLTASRRIARHIEGVLQVHNLLDHYTNDFDAQYATLGRQVAFGIRMQMK